MKRSRATMMASSPSLLFSIILSVVVVDGRGQQSTGERRRRSLRGDERNQLRRRNEEDVNAKKKNLKKGGGGGAFNPNLEAYDPNSATYEHTPISNGASNGNTVSDTYLSEHPWYPNHDQLTCVNSAEDGSPPDFMTWEGGYAESHLFTAKSDCCARWFPDMIIGCSDSLHTHGYNATAATLEVTPTVQNYCGVTWADANDNCLTPCPSCIAGVSCSACAAGEQCFTFVSSCPSMTLDEVEELSQAANETTTVEDGSGSSEEENPWYVNWEIGACINDGQQSLWEKEEDLFRFKEECCAYKFEYKFDTCLGNESEEGGATATDFFLTTDDNVATSTNTTEDVAVITATTANANDDATDDNTDITSAFDNVEDVANWDDNGDVDDDDAVVSSELPPPPAEKGEDEEEVEEEDTFPTFSCGSNMIDAKSCSMLCLSGYNCPEGLSCFPQVMCPSSKVAAAMGDAGNLIQDLVNPDDTFQDGTTLLSVCGVDYLDAERKCRAGGISPQVGETSLGMYGFSDDFLACDESGNCPLSSGQTCYRDIMCPLLPTMAPMTTSPVNPTYEDVTTDTPADDDDEPIDPAAKSKLEPLSPRTIKRKDKTEVVGTPPISSEPRPPAPAPLSSSTSTGASPYTLDISTLGGSEGLMPVASDSCSGGCPQGSTCVGSSSTGQLVKDEECTPCETGQTWWPCDIAGSCWCWNDGTDRIAPAPGSGVENELANDSPHYTVCDDILTREMFNTIAPEAKEPYTYEGLCDAMLSYNSKHTEKVFGMGNAYQRTAELSAFLGNTLHESDELKAGREYLMCADNVVVDGEVYCKPCDTGSFDWELKICNHGLVTGTSEFNEYCQPESQPPEACPCGQGMGDAEIEGYVAAKHLFFGRGSIQLSWNYNYIGASVALTGSPDTFCKNPDLVATEGKYAWGAGIYFWMEHSKEGTTCHIEALQDGGNFGGTLNNINGGLECPSAAGGWHHDAVKARLNRYCRAAKALTLPNLMPFDKCAGLQDSLDTCLSEGTCEDCKHFVGSTPGEIVDDFVPPGGSALTTAISTPTESSEPDSSLCPDGLLPWEDNPACCVPNPRFIGDGACDPDAPYNIEVCDFDGGDCCKGTCNKDTAFGCSVKEGDELADYGPFGFYCVDPSKPNAINSKLCQTDEKYRIGDGNCDPMLNNQDCNYDGGDCCEGSCSALFSFFQCGSGEGYDCIDERYIDSTPENEPTKDPTSTNSIPIDNESSTQPTQLCPMEMKECPGGEYVGRNPKNRCKFDPCYLPTQGTTTTSTAATIPVPASTTDPTALLTTETPKSCTKSLKECPGGEFVEQDPSNDCRYFPCPETPSFVASTEDRPSKEEPKVSLAAQIASVKKCDRDVMECSDGSFVERDPGNLCKFLECPVVENNEPMESLAASINSYAVKHMKEDESSVSLADSINFYASQFSDFTQKRCNADVRECNDGSFVERDPRNNCKFLMCPSSEKEEMMELSVAAKAASVHGRCSDEVKRCTDGAFIRRDPGNKCEWFECPSIEPSMNALSSPHVNTRDRPRDYLNANLKLESNGERTENKQRDHEAVSPCENDLLTCQDGSFVGRDLNNGCKFFNCPNENTDEDSEVTQMMMHYKDSYHGN